MRRGGEIVPLGHPALAQGRSDRAAGASGACAGADVITAHLILQQGRWVTMGHRILQQGRCTPEAWAPAAVRIGQRCSAGGDRREPLRHTQAVLSDRRGADAVARVRAAAPPCTPARRTVRGSERISPKAPGPGLAPERVDGGLADPRTDVYGVACTLAAVLGSDAIPTWTTGESLEDRCLRHASVESDLLQVGVPAEAARLLAEAMHPDPQRRHGGLDAIASGIAAIHPAGVGDRRGPSGVRNPSGRIRNKQASGLSPRIT